MVKLHDHATALYDALEREATTETIDGVEARVFRGSFVQLFRDLGISSALYSEVRKGLIESECISVIRRGTRGTGSIIVLHRRPDAESFVALETLGLTNEAEAAIVLQELQDLKRLIGSISIPDALLNIESRIRAFEKRITKVEQLLIKEKGDRSK